MKKDIWQNVHVSLIKYLALAMLFFTISRILFFLFNLSMFEHTTLGDFANIMLAGLRFDLSAVLYINGLFIALMLIPFRFRYRDFYRKILFYVFIFCNSIALAANLSDIIYYRFTLRRTTWSVFEEFANENLGALGWSFLLDYWYIFFLWIGLIFLMIFMFKQIKMNAPRRISSWIYYPLHTVTMAVAVGLCIAGMRGGFLHSTRPITLSNAGAYVERPKEMNLVLNTPFSMIRTIGKANFQKVAYFEDEKVLNSIYSPIHYPQDSLPFRPKNVVVIILESFSKEAMGGYNAHLKNKEGYQSFTPFLDTLMLQSKVYWHSFANGKKSIDALPSVLSGIPSLEGSFVLTPYAGNELPSLPRLLKEKGYHTSFFHGAPNGSMGFGAFMNLIGVEEYYGKNEYGNDAHFDGLWGIWDEEFLQFHADQMNTFPEPFMSSVFTVSSHHPHKIPARYEGKFPKGPLPIYECISYTDMALQKFFEKAETMPWYKNTLFVITADHTATAKHYPEYQTDWGAFSVPVLFFAPGDEEFRGQENRVVQQLDIMPTVLGYLNYDEPFFSFGKNMLNPDENPDFAINYLGVYQWFEGEYMIQFDGQQTVGFFNYVKDPLLKEDLRGKLPEQEAYLQSRIKAFIQQYNNRMIEDELAISDPTTIAGRDLTK